MNNYKTKYKLWSRVLASILVCLFTINTLTWAAPLENIQINKTTLQVQSIFKPILDIVGKEYDTQLRVELACILAMALKDKDIPFHDINAVIDEWLSVVPEIKQKKRILDVVSNPRKEKDGQIIEVTISNGPGEGRTFKITSTCENISSIEKDESGIKIEEIPVVQPQPEGEKAIVVTIDGPSGAGKSTVARRIAKRLNAVYFSYSIIYRLITAIALQKNIDLGKDMKPEELRRLLAIAENIDLTLFSSNEVNGRLSYFYAGAGINHMLYTENVEKNVPFVAAIPEVRAIAVNEVKTAMVDAIKKGTSWVMEGRVTGTEIAPDADVKIYLTASLTERAKRRAEQQIRKEGAEVTGEVRKRIIAEVSNKIAERDSLDSQREHMPAKKPAGAIEIDTTGKSLDRTEEEVWEIIDGLNNVVLELERDMVLDGTTRQRLSRFYERYIILRERFSSTYYSQYDKYFAECFSAKRIADLFYLSEVYQFNVLDLLAERGRTQWVKRAEGGTIRYVFEIEKGNIVAMKDASVEGVDPVEVARATNASYGLMDPKACGGLNIGNFIIKINHFLQWAGKNGRIDVDVLIAVTSGINELINYYETIGARIYQDFDGDSRAYWDLFGGLDAGILTRKQSERIKSLDPHIWRIWSQRELDRYFRLTEHMGDSHIVAVNEAFSLKHKADSVEELRAITPKKVAEFIIEQVKQAKYALPQITEDKKLAVEIKPLFESSRSLAVIENTDAIDQALKFEAERRNTRYLRLTLNDLRELDRLKSRVSIKNGQVQIAQGPLAEIITTGGILLIDYSGSKAQLIEGFNSLFDKDDPFYEDLKASPDLVVVGAIGEKQFMDTDSTFRSRFDEIVFLKPGYKDPLTGIGKASEGEDLFTVELYGSPHFREKLLGGAYLDEDGNIQIQEGALIKAVRQGKPLLIKGDSWNDPAFLAFLRQIILHRSFEFNGEVIQVPENFAIYRESSNYAEGVVNKKILTRQETSLGELPVWIINEQNQDILFSRTHVTSSGRLVQLQGLLEDAKLRLRIDGPLADWVWHSIMHSGGEIEIELTSNAVIPKTYNSLIKSTPVREAISEKKRKIWEQAKREKAVFIEGDDLGFIRAALQDELGKDILVYPVTPETTLKQFTSEVGIEKRNDIRYFNLERKEIIEALKQGKTVIIEGVDVNNALLNELATALCDQPYLMDNGLRVNLADLPGRLIIISRTQKTGIGVTIENHVEMAPDPALMLELLNKRFPKDFNKEDFDRIMKLKDIFQTIPAPSISGIYPREVNLSFDRLCLLYQYDGDWLNAFEDVAISLYNDEPEIAAFMRIMVRLVFNIDDKAQKADTIHGRKLMCILNQIPPNRKWQDYFWQLTDTLSLDLVKALNLSKNYLETSSTSAFKMIEKALVKHHEDMAELGKMGTVPLGTVPIFPAFADFYRHKFNIAKGDDVTLAPAIDMDLYIGEENWQQRKEHAIRVLAKFRAVFFRGPPGTGKSFITDEIAREMGYSEDRIVGPITVGVDARETDLVARSIYKDGKTMLRDEAIGRWVPQDANRKGRLFIVDEANLTKPEFWNFLRAFFNQEAFQRYVWVNGQRRYFVDDDRIIFTGNQESLTGRKFQHLFQDHVITINFTPFDEVFLRKRLEEYLHADKSRRKDLIELMLNLYKIFSAMNPKIDFSLRDVQEFAARVNILLKADWKNEDMVLVAWKEYRGLFSSDEALALEHILMKKFGISVSSLEEAELKDIKASRSEKYQSAGITVTNGTARMIASIEDFLAIREARLSGKTLLQGKRGMIFEGPSGRGKDVILTQVLKDKGFIAGKMGTVPLGTVPIFYHINASTNVDEMIKIIQKARREGSIVIISEMNLLPSAFLEGRLNDCLTGSAHQGFALFATMNSMDYNGRERLSTALQNRVLYQRIPDYTQEELYEIAVGKMGTVPSGTVPILVNTHAWIRENITRPNLKPTTRELLRAVKLVRDKGMSPQEAIQKVYGLFYLCVIARTSSGSERSEAIPLPPDTELLNFTEKGQVNNLEVLRLIGTFLITRPTTIKMDAVTKHGGYHSPSDNSITLSTRTPLDYQLRTVDHESGHGRFTRDFIGLTPGGDDPFCWLYFWLEDRRQEHAMKKLFPYIQLDELDNDEIGFIKAVKELDTNYLCTMTPQDLFKFLLSSYARDFITKEDVSMLRDVMDSLHPVNIAGYALKHLDTAKEIYECVPKNLDETEIEFQAYKAVTLLQLMKDDYLEVYNLSAEEKEEEDVSQERQMELVEKAKRALEEADIRPKAIGQGTGYRGQDTVRLKTKGEMEAIRESLRVQRERVMTKSKEEILKELALMERDLKHFPNITGGRLEEMLAQLENKHHPASLVARIEQLNDSKIKKRVRSLKTSIKKTIEALREMQAKISVQGREAEDEGTASLLNSLRKRYPRLNAFLDAVKRSFVISGGEMSGLSGAVDMRYPIAKAHREGSVSNPIAILIPRPEAKRVNLQARESARRDPRMKELTQGALTSLDLYIRDFFKTKLSIDRIWGSEGTLDVERFTAGDPTNAFFRSGGALERTYKELILSGKIEQGKWNIILDEFFCFLFERGFSVTVYTARDSYVQGVRTLGDLKRLLSQAEDVQKEKVLEDLSGRMRREDYEYVDIEELQKKIEAEYLYGAFKYQGTATKDEVLPKAGVQRTEEEKSRETVTALSSFQEDDIYDFAKMTRLNTLSISNADPEWVSTNSNRLIYKLFRLHPNRKNLKITIAVGNAVHVFDYDFFLLILKPRFENKLDYAKQRQALEQFLMGRGLALGLLTLNTDRTFTLDLSGIPIDDNDLRGLSDMALLRGIDLSWTRVTDLTPLRGLPNLTSVILPQFIRNREIYELYKSYTVPKKLVFDYEGGEAFCHKDIENDLKWYAEELSELDFDRQVETAKEVLRKAGFKDDEELVRARARGELEINYLATDLVDLMDLRRLTDVIFLDFRHCKWLRNLNVLVHLPKLRRIIISEEHIKNIDLGGLFLNHPNKDNLDVFIIDTKTGGSRKVTFESLFGKEKEEIKEEPVLSLDEQIALIEKIMRAYGIATGGRISVEGGGLKLNLSNINIEKIDGLIHMLGSERLVNIVAIDLRCSNVSNLLPLATLPNLKEIDIAGTPIAEDPDKDEVRALFVAMLVGRNPTLGERGRFKVFYGPMQLIDTNGFEVSRLLQHVEDHLARHREYEELDYDGRLDKIIFTLERSGRFKPGFTVRHWSGAVTKETMPGLHPLLLDVMNALLDPKAALEKVRQCFQEEGNLDSFDEIIAKLEKDFAEKHPSGQDLDDKAWGAIVALYNAREANKEEVPSPPRDREVRELSSRVQLIQKEMKIIAGTNTHSLQILSRIKSYLSKKDIPIDIVVDLSLIPKDDLEENMETWVYLVLMCRELKDVNFIFESADSKYKEKALETFKKELRAKGVLVSLEGASLEEFVARRINVPRGKSAIEIPIISKSYLESMNLEDEGNKDRLENQYPVALDGITTDADGALLNNFQAALTIGLCKAMLVVAKRSDAKKKNNERKELPDLRKEMLGQIQAVYNVVRSDIKLTEDTLDYMIHDKLVVRINRAIELYLPPIAKMAVEQLKSLHEGIQLALQAA